ncbi:gamma-glutamyl kinase [Intrasporangium oryzae NRRL B-24470]|uniref:Glutamate 5-kinase n=1 Tax=Intrasporangium oryzae NRRL B-24470 TaxID=1386089 RepID=W9GAQ1_9MICO|nr:glutamate 5-kinase [Intrasporangium oryzae]EWT03125.1 gamma-glutamyl kinase [Intrasporangium oryzae NRRL B-24470]
MSPRSVISSARRLVVKVGSSSLTGSDGDIDHDRLVSLADALARKHAEGTQVVLVSSGAIAAGLQPLGLSTRPRDLATQQAAASVGQGALLAAYTHAFGMHRITVGQVLLTADDVTRRSHYANARRTLERLLDLRVLPIVNENDTVATSEIRFGDNDRLAALVAHLIDADALVLLSDVDALYDGPPSRAGTSRIPLVRGPQDLAHVVIGGSGSKVGTGGMTTKVEAARIATAAGVTTAVTAADRVTEVLGGEDVGTIFLPMGVRGRSRRLWLEHATTARGRLIIDAGAVAALVHRKKSLLPAGITAVEGTFHDGDPVDVCSPDGVRIARGLVNYSSAELPSLLGRSTRELAADLGPEYEREVIHRDDLVVL